MNMTVDVSIGEFLDKLTILRIKSERVEDHEKLKNIREELTHFDNAWERSPLSGVEITSRVSKLKTINEKLWDIEARIRQKEARKQFDEEFIELARSVYRTNDERTDVKRELNLLLDSELVEEKSYAD